MRRETINDLVLALLFLAVIAMQAGLTFALVLMGALAWHEYGHVIAFRQAGHRNVRWRFIPFLGAVAWSDSRSKSQVEQVYVALMGPGFSLLLLALVTIAQQFVAPMSYEAYVLALASGLIGFLNVTNLFPLYPLDGSHALRAMLAGWAPPGVARKIMMGSGLALVALAFLSGSYFIGLFALFGVLSLSRADAQADEARLAPLTPYERLLCVAAYAACFMAHGLAAWPLVKVWFL